jgi:hypothetical protein
MKLPLNGGCICGAARYEITQDPVGVYACHCADCQRATVSAFSIGVAVPGEAFRLTGKELQPAPAALPLAVVPKRAGCALIAEYAFAAASRSERSRRVTPVSSGAAHLMIHHG